MEPSRRHTLLFTALALVACAAASRAPAEERPCWRPLEQPGLKAVGTLSCAATSCHDRQAPRTAPFAPRLQEYTQWLEHDPHAGAARTLASPRFQQILRAASARDDGAAEPAVYIRCAKCHDPQGLESGDGDVTPFLAQPQLVAGRGIGCETCHGQAEQWLDRHFVAGVTPDELESLGMIPLDDLVVRARLCAGCHIGDGDRDMNHDMIAAGHPPLRFELSAYHDLLVRKHWSDTERLATPHFKARLWAAGQLASADAALALLSARAERAAAVPGDTSPAPPWPELAEYDCFACHQRLRPGASAAAARVLRRAKGSPAWQPWNVAPFLYESGQAADELETLRGAMSKGLVTSPVEIGSQCRAARRALRSLPLPGVIEAGRYSAADILTSLECRPADEDASWSTAAHQYLALKAAYLSIADQQERDPPAPGTFSPDWKARANEELLALVQSLRFGSREFEWPAFDSDEPPTDRDRPPYRDLDEIQNALDRLAGLLKKQLPKGQVPP